MTTGRKNERMWVCTDKQEQHVNTRAAPIRLPVVFQRLGMYTAGDTRFIPVRIWMMHTGENYNGSVFSKEVTEDAVPSLANTPILAFVGKNNAGEKDFLQHEFEIRRSDNGIVFTYAGRAIGVIPESNNVQFINRVCDDGVEREFLVADGLIWTKWDDPVDIFNRDHFKYQSMEICDDYEGYEDENGLYHFTKFRFFGACALGDDYLPAMHDAAIEVKDGTCFSLDGFRAEIQDRMEQFKQAASEDGKGVCHGLGTEKMTAFAATYKQKREALNVALNATEKAAETAGADIWFWLSDFDDKHVFVERHVYTETGYEEKYGRIAYTWDDAMCTAKITGTFEEMVVKWLTLAENAALEAERAAAEAVKKDFEQYKRLFSVPDTETEALKTFKTERLAQEREAAVSTLFSEFDGALGSVAEYGKLKENAGDMSVADIENQCLILFAKEQRKGKTTFTQKNDGNPVRIPAAGGSTAEVSPYGDLFD